MSVSKQETSFVIKNVYWDDEYYNDSPTTEHSKTTTKDESETENSKTTKRPTKNFRRQDKYGGRYHFWHLEESYVSASV